MARTSVQEILEGSMVKIHHSPSEWMKFLGFHAKFHRYNTINAALIYAQRPDATACASMNFWNNRLNRWIKRGSHGIRVLQPDGASVRYVFDVADTTGDPGTHPHIWQVSERELPVFLDYLNAPEAESVQGRIQKLVHEITEALLPEIMDDVQLNRQDTLLEELDELNLKVTCRDLVSSSAAYMTMKRLGVSPEDVLIEEDFRGVVDFSSPALQTVLDVHVHEISKQVLDTFELCTRHRQEILAERERFSEDLSKNGAEPPLQEPTFTQRYRQEEEIKEGTEHDPQVRNDAQNLSGGTQARGVRPVAADGQTERPSGGSGHASQDAGAGADRTSPEGTSRARHEQSAGMGAAHEQPEAHGGGSGAEAAGLRLIEGGQGKSPQQVHTTKPREPNSKSGSFSMPDSGQISMFAMPAVEQPEGQFRIGQQYISQDEIDLVLRCGSNEPQSPLRICAKFRWDKPLEENADFLRREFRLDGRGFIINDRQLAAWFDQDGIHLARGNSAQVPSAHVITWAEATKRIRELLDEGKYVSQPELDYSQYYERKRLGERIWHAYRDSLGGLPEELELPSGFPDASAKLTDMLGNPEGYKQLSEHLENRIQMLADKPHGRWYRENIPQLLQDVEDLQREPLSFQSDMLDAVQYKRFITADEIDDVLRQDYVSEKGKRIYTYFREGHTQKEREVFLKDSYGIGGYGSILQDVTYDTHGIRISRGSLLDPEARVQLKWKQVAARIQTLIAEGRYLKGEPPREQVPTEVVEAIAEAPEKKYDLDFVHTGNGLNAVNRVNDEKVAQINADGTIQYTDPDMPVEQIDRITKKAEIYWNDIGLNEQSEDLRSPGSENPSEDGQQPKLESQTVAFYAAEETHLPYDVEIRTIRTVEPAREVPEIPVANYRIHDDHLGEGGARTKADRNIEAIRLLKRIEGENRSATAEEQEVLAQYVGWGGIPQIFDGQNADWKDRYAALKEVLTDTEYASARASTLNAHYTSPVVIRSIYQALENMGFRTGNVLEPACGTGNFFGMLPDSMEKSRMYGVELDSITGRLAKQLYPKANIRVQGFETTDYPDNFFDVSIGNVPFGSYKLPDKRYDKHKLLIHDYFFYKSLDQVRPGGIVAFITSKGTLDKKDESIRKYLAERADLLGAIRLPNTAFFKNAGTEVTTDIIFLQKRDEPNLNVPDWVHVGETEDGVPVNRYFLNHPEMLLGTMRFDSSRFGSEQETTCEPIEGRDLGEQLSQAIQNIRGTYRALEIAELEADEEVLPADPDVQDYSYAVIQNKLYFRENSVMKPVKVNATAEKRIRGMVELRDICRELLTAQLENHPEEQIADLQKRLNERYDVFVEKYGCLFSRANALAFEDDDGYYLLTSLEVTDDERNFVRKADIFSKRTIQPAQIPEHVDSAQEALILSMSERGRIDFDYMTSLTGKDTDSLIDDLQGQIFQDPRGNPEPYEQWKTADEYLSGNVREKLETAKIAAEMLSERYAANVAALEKVQPVDLEPHEIDVRLGASWLPAEDVNEFMYELLNTGRYVRDFIKVQYCAYTSSWNISGKSMDQANVRVRSQYGTGRANAYKILEECLNLRDIRIYDTVEDENGKEKRVLNSKETILAGQKQTLIREAFQDWIWKDSKRAKRLCRLYNDRFNNLRLRQYDGSHLSFSGLNPEIRLRPHQKDAVARILYGGNTLLAHVVGAGKTAVMVSGIMEKKRLGLARKALVVVPNHLTQQTAAEFLRFYPAAKVLVATKKDFQKANRKRFIAKIATGDYDAIILGHTQFEKIPISKERQRAMLEEQLEEIMQGIEELEQSNAERFTVKELERTRKSVEARLERLNDDSDKDQVITFELLGADMLFVDEAHGFKNCAIVTKMRNVAGVQTTEAKKSFDMMLKCRYISEITDYKGVTFATGTPISNSMVELFNMQRYLQLNELQSRGLAHFDAWAGTFGETTTGIELAPEGTGYRTKTRFSKFFNLPELVSMFRMVADVQTADMLKLPVPDLKGGQVQNIRTEASPFQKELVARLGERAEAIRNGKIKPTEDNMLKVTNDGRMLALDARLIDPDQPDDPNSKVNACVRNVLRIYGESVETRSAQIIFCDLSTPRNDGGFDVYNDIKGKLMAQGVPEEEIAFIHDANNDVQKEALFAKVRSGNVRVLIGSTPRMGAGTNIQQRLIALHHLDVPWRPSDLQQRDGRILRQGNENPEVEVLRYITESTFDAYSYQLVESKQRFISQIFTSKTPVRGAEDTDEVALSYAEVKALAAGNPKIKEKMDLDVQVSKLRLIKGGYQTEQLRLQSLVEEKLPFEISKYKCQLENLNQDIEHFQSQHTENFSMELWGHSFDKRADAAEYLGKLAKLQKNGEPVRVGMIYGFELYLEKSPYSSDCYANIHGSGRYSVSLGDSDLGNIARIENVLKELPKRKEDICRDLEKFNVQLEEAKEQLGKPFPQEEELRTKSQRLVELNAELDVGGGKVCEIIDDGEEVPARQSHERSPIEHSR